MRVSEQDQTMRRRCTTGSHYTSVTVMFRSLYLCPARAHSETYRLDTGKSKSAVKEGLMQKVPKHLRLTAPRSPRELASACTADRVEPTNCRVEPTHCSTITTRELPCACTADQLPILQGPILRTAPCSSFCCFFFKSSPHTCLAAVVL